MSRTAQFVIGAEVRCDDAVCGEVVRVVVDPVARAVTHLVVEAKHRRGLGRLVPVEMVDTSGEGLRLQCSAEGFERLEHAEETHFLPGTAGEWGYGSGQVLSWPYFGLAGGMGMSGVGGGGMGMGAMGVGVNAPQPVSVDRVPLGEVEVCRGDRVHATDGAIGSVQGLVIDPADRHVTHVLLAEGHLWGRKEVAIPISAVTGVEDGIRLAISKAEVQDLPPVNLDPAGGPLD